MSETAYVGLGSNVGDRIRNLQQAVVTLVASQEAQFVRSSAVYETEPVGPPQPDYLNAVIEIRTSLGPQPLLERLKTVESEVGRVDRERWGPREIDLDLLLYGTASLEAEGLRVPHPEMAKRAFVLVPLADLAPFAKIPGQGVVATLLDALETEGVRYHERPEVLWPERLT